MKLELQLHVLNRVSHGLSFAQTAIFMIFTEKKAKPCRTSHPRLSASNEGHVSRNIDFWFIKMHFELPNEEKMVFKLEEVKSITTNDLNLFEQHRQTHQHTQAGPRETAALFSALT